MTRLNDLIELVGCSEFASVTTSDEVRSIIDYQQVFFSPAYAGMSRMFGETATVTCPDGTVHMVQITVAGPRSNKNQLCCITCDKQKKSGHCPAAVAALITKLVQKPAPNKDICPSCGQPSPPPPTEDEIFREALVYKCSEAAPEMEDEPTPIEQVNMNLRH